jgi:hypothetical protein
LSSADVSDRSLPVNGLRRALAAIFVFGSAGTGAELLLLEHVDGVWQQIPLILMALGCGALVVVEARPSGGAVRAFQLTMIAFMASGILGVWLHYQGNVEFELELQPEAGGAALFWEAMKGATPALAPGTMALLGAIGLTYAYRHPAGAVRL